MVSKTKKVKNQRLNNYIYRYEINTEMPKSVHSDPIIEVIKENLEALLEVVILTYNGKEVTVDGFKLLNNNEIYSLFR